MAAGAAEEWRFVERIKRMNKAQHLRGVDREIAREIIGEDAYKEVFINASLKICESRDPKGLYAKARAGQIADFTGISSPYEVPSDPDLIINTAELDVEESLSKLMSLFR